MGNKLKWPEFETLAQATLFQGQIIDIDKQYIQLVIEPSFDNSINLQLEIGEEAVKWYRTTWSRLIDTPKFHNPVEGLKYIGQEIKPTINYEKGVIDAQKIATIIGLAKMISIKPILKEQKGIVLDGINYTLTIHVEGLKITYKWHYLEEGWNDLEQLRLNLEEFNSELPYA